MSPDFLPIYECTMNHAEQIMKSMENVCGRHCNVPIKMADLEKKMPYLYVYFNKF